MFFRHFDHVYIWHFMSSMSNIFFQVHVFENYDECMLFRDNSTVRVSSHNLWTSWHVSHWTHWPWQPLTTCARKSDEWSFIQEFQEVTCIMLNLKNRRIDSIWSKRAVTSSTAGILLFNRINLYILSRFLSSHQMETLQSWNGCQHSSDKAQQVTNRKTEQLIQ